MAFITEAELTDYLGYTLDASKATLAVDSACDELRMVAEQDFDYTEDDVAILDSEGEDTLLLPELPVWGVTSVVGPASFALVEGTNFVLDKEQGSIRTKARGTKFLKGRQIYTVTYTRGYAETADLPDPNTLGVKVYPQTLKLLALQLAARIYDQGIVSSESVGGVSMSYAAPESIVLTDRERGLLEKVVGVGRRRI